MALIVESWLVSRLVGWQQLRSVLLVYDVLVPLCYQTCVMTSWGLHMGTIIFSKAEGILILGPRGCISDPVP